MTQSNLVLKLIKDTSPAPHPTHYYLHLVLTTNYTDYKPVQPTSLPTTLNADGEYELELVAFRDPDSFNFQMDTPICFTLDLGPMPNGHNGTIRVSVVENHPLLGIEKIGEGTMDTTDAEDDTRPIKKGKNNTEPNNSEPSASSPEDPASSTKPKPGEGTMDTADVEDDTRPIEKGRLS